MRNARQEVKALLETRVVVSVFVIRSRLPHVLIAARRRGRCKLGEGADVG